MENTPLPNLNTTSGASILKATGIALVVALVILFTVILPVEYGIDPLKTGSALGLSRIFGGGAAPVAGKATPAQTGIISAEANLYKVDTEDFQLRPGESVEYKYHLRKGASMVYAWKATGKVQFEFHGEPDKKPRPDYFESYQLENKVGADQYYGTFIAPSTGIHGWFLQNKGKEDVKIHLNTAGFYDSAKMFSGGPGEDMPVDDVK